MDYLLIKDCNGKIINVMVDGKYVKPMYMRGMTKAQKTSYWHEYTEPGNGTNAWTHVAIPLDALEKSIFMFCIEWYARYEDDDLDQETPIQTFDDMKYFLLFLNPHAYMELLD